MTKIIPAILAKTKEEFERKLDIVCHLAQEIQIDIMDGRFVPNATWGDTEEIKKMGLPPYEVHLMILNPEDEIEKWAAAGARRIIFHFEAADNPGDIIQKIKSLGLEAGVAINPETPVSSIVNLFDILDAVLLMGVNPGFSGQGFREEAVEKVAEIRKLNQNISIEVDGGVGEDNAADLARAGVNGLVAASAIFGSENPQEAYNKLFKITNPN